MRITFLAVSLFFSFSLFADHKMDPEAFRSVHHVVKNKDGNTLVYRRLENIKKKKKTLFKKLKRNLFFKYKNLRRSPYEITEIEGGDPNVLTVELDSRDDRKGREIFIPQSLKYQVFQLVEGRRIRQDRGEAVLYEVEGKKRFDLNIQDFPEGEYRVSLRIVSQKASEIRKKERLENLLSRKWRGSRFFWRLWYRIRVWLRWFPRNFIHFGQIEFTKENAETATAVLTEREVFDGVFRVTFDMSESSSTIGEIQSYTVIVLRDGEEVQRFTNDPNQTTLFDIFFSERGTYIIRLEVTDGVDTDVIESREITPINLAPITEFTLTGPREGFPDIYSVDFTGSRTNDGREISFYGFTVTDQEGNIVEQNFFNAPRFDFQIKTRGDFRLFLSTTTAETGAFSFLEDAAVTRIDPSVPESFFAQNIFSFISESDPRDFIVVFENVIAESDFKQFNIRRTNLETGEVSLQVFDQYVPNGPFLNATLSVEVAGNYSFEVSIERNDGVTSVPGTIQQSFDFDLGEASINVTLTPDPQTPRRFIFSSEGSPGNFGFFVENICEFISPNGDANFNEGLFGPSFPIDLPRPGIWRLECSALTNTGLTASFNTKIEIVNELPTANLEVVLVNAATREYELRGSGDDRDGFIVRGEFSITNPQGTTQIVEGSGEIKTILNQPGVYLLSYRVIDNDNEWSQLVSSQISITNQLPVISFSITPSGVGVERKYDLTSRLEDLDGQIVSASYEFIAPDGERFFRDAFSPIFEEKLEAVGMWKIILTAVDNDGGSGSVEKNVDVMNLGPASRYQFTLLEDNKTLSILAINTDFDGFVVAYDVVARHPDGDVISRSFSTNPFELTLQKPGVWSIEFMSIDNDGGRSGTRTQLYEIENLVPVASLEFLENSPQSYTFDASGSFDQDGDISTYKFTFTSPEQEVFEVVQAEPVLDYFFPTDRGWTVSLSVFDDLGLESSNDVSLFLDVQPLNPDPPVVVFFSEVGDPTRTNFRVGDTIIFDSSLSTTSRGEITGQKWFVDDVIASEGEQVEISSNQVGTTNVKLIVENSFGKQSEVDFTVTVSPDIDPVISIDKVNQFAPVMINASVESLDGLIPPFNYAWKVFDIESSEEVLSANLENVGNYLVLLELTDGQGYTYTVEEEVFINSQGPYITGDNQVDVFAGNISRSKYEFYGLESDGVASLSVNNTSISLNQNGLVQIDGSDINSLPDSFEIILSSGGTSFSKSVSINKAIPSLIAETPAGFSGIYKINYPGSPLDGADVTIDDVDSQGGNSVRLYTAGNPGNERLIVRSDFPLINGIQIRLNNDSRFEIIGGDDSFSVGNFFRRESLVDDIKDVFACSFKFLFNNLRVNFIKPTSNLAKYTGHPRAIDNNVFIDSEHIKENSDEPEKQKLALIRINRFLDNVSSIIEGRGINLYLLDGEKSKQIFGSNVSGKVVFNVKDSIFINLSAYNSTDVVWRGVIYHELRHTEQHNLLGCRYVSFDEENSDLRQFLMETDAQYNAFLNLIPLKRENFKRFLEESGLSPRFSGPNYQSFSRFFIEERGLGPNRRSPYLFPHFWTNITSNNYFSSLGNSTIPIPANMNDFLESHFLSKELLIELTFQDLIFPYRSIGVAQRIAEELEYPEDDRSFLNDRMIENEIENDVQGLSGLFYAIDLNKAREDRVIENGNLQINIESENLNGFVVTFEGDISRVKRRFNFSNEGESVRLLNVEVNLNDNFLYLYVINPTEVRKNIKLSIPTKTRKFIGRAESEGWSSIYSLNSNIEGDFFFSESVKLFACTDDGQSCRQIANTQTTNLNFVMRKYVQEREGIANPYYCDECFSATIFITDLNLRNIFIESTDPEINLEEVFENFELRSIESDVNVKACRAPDTAPEAQRGYILNRNTVNNDEYTIIARGWRFFEDCIGITGFDSCVRSVIDFNYAGAVIFSRYGTLNTIQLSDNPGFGVNSDTPFPPSSVGEGCNEYRFDVAF